MRKLLALVTAMALPVSAACTVHQATAPSESGPAEAALSLKLAANPDRVVQDGSQSSRISVTAFDAGGHAIAVQVHLSVQPAGFGTISTDSNGNLMTVADASRPTTVTYIPPASTAGNSQTVTISATLVGPDAVAASTQQVSLTVSPATVISSAAPTAVMTITPSTSSYVVNRAITFDGSGSCAGAIIGGVCSSPSTITLYRWSFGDNTTGTGTTIGHSYTAVGTYAVTLTVTNAAGLSATTSQTITVATVAAPTASYNVSPGTIKVSAGDPNAFFNATASTAASGHSIVRYAWNFGDGTTATTTTSTVSHFYSVANTYKTTLTVTDDLGQTTTGNLDVTVAN